MTDEAAEQVLTRVLGEHRGVSLHAVDGRWVAQCGCGGSRTTAFPGSAEEWHRAHVAAELAAALREAWLLIEGETEWGTRLIGEERVYCCSSKEDAQSLVAKNWRPNEVVSRTRYPHRVTDWQPIKGGVDDE